MHETFEAVSILHDGLELLGKGYEFLKSTVGETITTALAFRNAHDGVVATFDRFRESIEVVRARLGDAFLPTLMGIQDALRPIIAAMTNWLTVNNRWLAQRIGDTLATVATVLLDAIYPAVVLVSTAFYGWKELFQVPAIAFNKLAGTVLGGLASMSTAWATWEDAIGNRDKAIEWNKTAAGLRTMQKAAEDLAGEQVVDLENTVRAGDAAAAGYAKTRDTIRGVIDATHALITARAKASTTGGTDSTDDAARNAQLVADLMRDAHMNANFGDEAVKSFDDLRAAGEAAKSTLLGISRQEIDLAAQAKNAGDDQAKRLLEQEGVLQAQAKAARADATAWNAAEKKDIEEKIHLYNTLGTSIGGVFGQLAAGSIKSADAMKAISRAVIGSVREAAMKAIEAHAAASAAAAYESQAGIPIIGPFLGVAAAGAAFAFVEAYLQKFHDGGWHSGSGERPVMVEGGEYTMSRKEVAAGAPKWAQGGQGGLTLNVSTSIQSLTPDSDASFIRKAGRHIEAVVTDAIKAGRIRVEPA